MSTPSPAVLAKARGVVAAGQVRPVPAIVFEVGPYLVVMRETGPWCSCRATMTCKHIAAAGLHERNRAAICAAAGQPYTPSPTITDAERASGEAAFDRL